MFCPIVFDIDSRSLSACTVLYYHCTILVLSLFMTTCLTCLYFLAYFLIVSYICSIFPTLISLAVASSASLVHFPCLTPLLMLHVTSCASGLASRHFSALMLCATLSHALCHHFSCFTSLLMLGVTSACFMSLLMLYMTLHASHALLLMLYGTSHA